MSAYASWSLQKQGRGGGGIWPFGGASVEAGLRMGPPAGPPQGQIRHHHAPASAIEHEVVHPFRASPGATILASWQPAMLPDRRIAGVSC